MCYSYSVYLITINVPTNLQGDPNVPGGQITFDVDLRRPITDELEPSEQEQNLGVCHSQEFALPSAYEARYTNFPNVCLARYRNDVYCAHSTVSICSLVIAIFNHLFFLSQDMVSCLFVVCCASLITIKGH